MRAWFWVAPRFSAFELEFRQSRLQVRNPRVGDFRSSHLQTLQRLERLQMLEARIRDLSLVKSEIGQFVQARQMLQSGVRHLRTVQPQRRPAFRLTELLQALIRHTRSHNEQGRELRMRLQFRQSGIGYLSLIQVQSPQLWQPRDVSEASICDRRLT